MIRTPWFELEPVMAAYVAAWTLAVVSALTHLWLKRREYAEAYLGYGAFLLAPWKVGFFALATALITWMAPYTTDPTWDRIDAPLMATLSFFSAAWVLGVLYRWRRTPPSHLAVAAVLWMLSASWCYDGYLLFRDGMYPITWWSNIVASSILYIIVGLVWNLDVRPGRGATFAFMEPTWLLPPTPGATTRILLWASPFLLLGAASLAYFVDWGR
ncbi:MAG: hypothetical protein JNN03_03255 [Rubrivivax sp.]|nr:hypothetical protein [Rubrivivax sp.]